MPNVSKEEFDKFMTKHDFVVFAEKDIEYWYDNYATRNGRELGFISYHSNRDTTYHIHD